MEPHWLKPLPPGLLGGSGSSHRRKSRCPSSFPYQPSRSPHGLVVSPSRSLGSDSYFGRNHFPDCGLVRYHRAFRGNLQQLPSLSPGDGVGTELGALKQ